MSPAKPILRTGPATGAGERHIPLQRPAGKGPVIPAVAGTTLLEQRGGELVALSG